MHRKVERISVNIHSPMGTCVILLNYLKISFRHNDISPINKRVFSYRDETSIIPKKIKTLSHS